MPERLKVPHDLLLQGSGNHAELAASDLGGIGYQGDLGDEHASPFRVRLPVLLARQDRWGPVTGTSLPRDRLQVTKSASPVPPKRGELPLVESKGGLEPPSPPPPARGRARRRSATGRWTPPGRTSWWPSVCGGLKGHQTRWLRRKAWWMLDTAGGCTPERASSARILRAPHRGWSLRIRQMVSSSAGSICAGDEAGPCFGPEVSAPLRPGTATDTGRRCLWRSRTPGTRRPPTHPTAPPPSAPPTATRPWTPPSGPPRLLSCRREQRAASSGSVRDVSGTSGMSPERSVRHLSGQHTYA